MGVSFRPRSGRNWAQNEWILRNWLFWVIWGVALDLELGTYGQNSGVSPWGKCDSFRFGGLWYDYSGVNVPRGLWHPVAKSVCVGGASAPSERSGAPQTKTPTGGRHYRMAGGCAMHCMLLLEVSRGCIQYHSGDKQAVCSHHHRLAPCPAYTTTGPDRSRQAEAASERDSPGI